MTSPSSSSRLLHSGRDGNDCQHDLRNERTCPSPYHQLRGEREGREEGGRRKGGRGERGERREEGGGEGGGGGGEGKRGEGEERGG